MTQTPDEFDLPLDVLERLDRVCKRFEDDWRAGGVPQIPDYLERLGAERRLLFRELLHADAELRRGRGLPSSLVAYGGQFPEYRDLLEALAAAERPGTSAR
jgi:hypothetical protein